MIEQLDLTEHVFRSVRGWLHRLYPADTILIERRRDEKLTNPDAPIWNLVLASGPTWKEHTGASSMVSYVIKVTKVTDQLWDAQRSAGAVTANATRPAGRIRLRGYNLRWPQQPNIGAGEAAETAWPDGPFDIATAAVNPDGDVESAPGERVTCYGPAGAELVITQPDWPYGSTRFAVYAALQGEPLAYQGYAQAGNAYRLVQIDPGSTPPTNVSCDLFGLRVDSAESEVQQIKTDGDPAYQAVVQLGLTVQVPLLLDAHLDADLVP